MNPEITTTKNWYWWLWLSPLLTIPTLIGISNLDLGYVWLSCNTSKCDYVLAYHLNFLAGLIGSALWHLVLLIPTLNKLSSFVHWHGRQALMLASIRTFIPLFCLGFGIVSGLENFVLISIPFLIVVWAAGTAWGQVQAGRGDCSLMRWMGHGAGLPLQVILGDESSEGAYPMRDGKPDYLAVFKQGREQQELGLLDIAGQTFYGLLHSNAPLDLKAEVALEFHEMGEAGFELDNDMLVTIFRFSRNQEKRQKVFNRLKQLEKVEKL